MISVQTFSLMLLAGGLLMAAPVQAEEASANTTQRISPVDTRPSLVVNKSAFKQYFSGGEVRIDFLYPATDDNMQSAAYVTFEPGARTHWHTHPAGQHMIVTSGVGYTQTWKGERRTLRVGDVVWCPVGVKHWHGASEKIAMTHLVITGSDKNGKNVEWLEPVTDEQYAGK
ncbi:cupin domain-containing protein [Sulfurimonas sp. HSL-1656]|uniref:(R)-mandelonitrile lyase n=1 Tax=Thiomicrolovo subterrani TaxID=3131934 RepID=UPI0031F9E801